MDSFDIGVAEGMTKVAGLPSSLRGHTEESAKRLGSYARARVEANLGGKGLMSKVRTATRESTGALRRQHTRGLESIRATSRSMADSPRKRMAREALGGGGMDKAKKFLRQWGESRPLPR